MRFLSYLTRRYTIRQSIALLLPSIGVLLTVQTAAGAIGIYRPIAAAIGLIAGIGTLLVIAALLDRRAPRS